MPDLNPQEPAPAYIGLQTFNKFPYAVDADELRRLGADVAIIGAPFDTGVVFRPGARFGPNAIRSANYYGSPVHRMYHLGMDVEPLAHLRVVDFGDANCPPGAVDVSVEAIKRKVGEALEAGAIPIVLGGDHTIVLPDVTAVVEHYGRGKVAVVHFDAHADNAPASYGGSLINHATPVRRLLEAGVVEGRHYIEVGLRGYWPPKRLFGWMEAQGMRWHLMAEIEERGLEAVLEDVLREARESAPYLFISVDIDVLDPAYAPGTGGLEPGGLTAGQLLRAIRTLVGGAEFVGMDICEVSPPWDGPAGITSVVANRVAMEAISALALKRARQAP